MTEIAPVVDAAVRPAEERRRQRICAGLAAAGLVLRIALRATVLNTVVDDAYIFFRYARNGAFGNGLVYNVGHQVLGYTSPIYTLVLTVLAWVFGPGRLPAISVVVGLAGYTAGSVLLCRLAARHRAGIAVAIAWAGALVFVDGSLNGMETMLFATTVLLVVHELEHGRCDTALASAAAAVLVRPEGWLVAFAAVAVLLRRGRPLPWRGALVGAAGVVAWLGYATLVYGSPVPQSITAKAGHTAGLVPVGGPLAIAAQLAFGISTSTFSSLGAPGRAGLEAVAACGALICVREAVRGLRAGRGVSVFPLTYLLIAAAYVVGHPVRIWSWYTVVPALCWLWPVTSALSEPGVLGRWRAGVEPALAALAAATATATLIVGAPRRQQVNAQAFAGVSAAIGRLRPPPQVVMLGDIGLVGWQSRARIIDLSGLVSTEPAMRVGGTLPSLGRLIERLRPDVVVLNRSQPIPGWVVEGSLARPAFDSEAQAVQFTHQYVVLPVPDASMVVYIRADRGG